ncbi:MAG: helix-turn-helix domain-containing protein [Clostridiales bacterium]|nr:helix-turn-helix domain-containing protein [Clostridiales bacterium]
MEKTKDTDTEIKFRERFNECLHYARVRQTDLAHAANVSKQCISDYKSGKSMPSIDTLFRICKYLDVSADYLLGLED